MRKIVDDCINLEKLLISSRLVLSNCHAPRRFLTLCFSGLHHQIPLQIPTAAKKPIKNQISFAYEATICAMLISTPLKFDVLSL